MLSENTMENLRSISKRSSSCVLFDEPLAKHTTISIGGPAEALYMPSDPEELSELLEFLRRESIDFFVLGNGSNVLVPDDGLDKVVIKLQGTYFEKKVFTDNYVTAGAGTKLSSLIKECRKRGLSGLEGLIGIPGTVGGALFRNASYKSSISDPLVKVLVIDRDSELRWIDKEEISFTYRASSFGKAEIILEAIFCLDSQPRDSIDQRMKEYFKEKLESQPLGARTLGSVFKNPGEDDRKSWELIDKCGLRGRLRGGAKVSQKHANFIVNTGGATSQDFKTLLDEVSSAVKEKFSIELTPEVEIL